jgi:hypothetical protein
MTEENINLGKFEVVEKNEDERLVFGWFSVVEEAGELVKDSQGDHIQPAVLEKAVYDYVENKRIASEGHVNMGVGTLVESIMFTKAKQDALGIDLGKVGWWGGFKITDDAVWKSVKDMEYPMFSIGGSGTRETIKDE